MPSPEPSNSRDCACGLLQTLADDANSPVAFDPITKSFGIKSRDDRWFMPIRYCFRCGGKAPDHSDELFVRASPDEEEELLSIVHRCSSIDDVVKTLGSPDRVVTADEMAVGSSGSPSSTKPVDRYYQYLCRWKTIDVTVLCYSDGEVDFCWSPKLNRDRAIDLGNRDHPE